MWALCLDVDLLGAAMVVTFPSLRHMPRQRRHATGANSVPVLAPRFRVPAHPVVLAPRCEPIPEPPSWRGRSPVPAWREAQLAGRTVRARERTVSHIPPRGREARSFDRAERSSSPPMRLQPRSRRARPADRADRSASRAVHCDDLSESPHSSVRNPKRRASAAVSEIAAASHSPPAERARQDQPMRVSPFDFTSNTLGSATPESGAGHSPVGAPASAGGFTWLGVATCGQPLNSSWEAPTYWYTPQPLASTQTWTQATPLRPPASAPSDEQAATPQSSSWVYCRGSRRRAPAWYLEKPTGSRGKPPATGQVGRNQQRAAKRERAAATKAAAVAPTATAQGVINRGTESLA